MQEPPLSEQEKASRTGRRRTADDGRQTADGQPATDSAVRRPSSAVGRPPSAGFIPLAALGRKEPSQAERDRAAVRERLANLRGSQYWRSLEELAGTPEFQRFLEREFPIQAPRDMKPLTRREFFRVMGAGL